MRLFLVILIIGFACLATAQPSKLNFTHYPAINGLLPGLNKITQDKDGFLWIGGYRGLVRFDGYKFENFNEIIFNKQNQRVTALLADGEYIWIGTEQEGLFKYHPVNNSLEKFVHKPGDESSLSDNLINYLFKDSQNNLWIGTWFGLTKYLHESGKFENYYFSTPESKTIYNYNRIEKITEDQYGNLWIGTWGGGLHKFDPQQKVFEHFENLDKTDSEENLWVIDILPDGDHLWVASVGSGLFRFNIETKTVKHFDFFPNSLSKGYSRLLCLFPFSKNEIWVGSEEGLIRFNKISGEYTIIKDTGEKKNSLLNRNVESIFEDDHKGIWIIAGGLNYYNYGAAKFLHFSPGDLSMNEKDDEIHGFLEVSSEEIWISKSSGISRFNPETGKLSETKKVLRGFTHKMLKLKNGNIASISLRDGFSIIIPNSGTLKTYTQSENLATGLVSSVLLDMAEDNVGNIWITSNNGLTLYRESDQKFVHLIENRDYRRGLTAKTVTRVIIDHQENIWIGTNQGLLQLEFLDSTLLKSGGPSGIISDTAFYAFDKKLNTPNMRHSVFEKGKFWMAGTMIEVYDPNMGIRDILVGNEEMINKEVRSMSMDENHGLWLATSTGLSLLNTKTNELTNFYENDGIQSNGFNQYAILKATSGEIYVGGNNGFNIIRPEFVEFNNHAPRVVVSQISIYNKILKSRSALVPDDNQENTFLLDKNISYYKEITLDHNQNLISIEFSALNFLYPEENQYAYMIDGIDKDWNHIGNRRFTSFSNLPEGRWLTLRIKGSNNNGIWNNQETTLNIFINPPFWNTTWFKVLASIFIVGLVFGVYFFRVRQLKNQRQNLEKQVQERTFEIKEKQKEIEAQNQKLLIQSEELKVQNSNTLLFSEMGKKITASINLEEVFEKIYYLLNEVIDAPHLAIGEVAGDGNSIEYWEIIGGKISSQAIALTNDSRLSIYAFKRNESIFSNNLKEDVRLYLKEPDNQYQSDGINSSIYIPLQSPTNKNIGIMVVKSKRKNAFDQKNLTLLQNIAVYVSIALDNSSKYKKIQKQSEQLAELDRIKTRFYTNISHEFRTPLSLIIGPAETLKYDKQLTPKQKEYMEIIHLNANRLLRLVTQIMDLSKLEDGVLRLEVAEGNISETLMEIIESFYFLAEKKNVNFKIKSSIKSAAGFYDKDKIEKIIYNLLNNAFKYTDDGQSITVYIDFKTHNQESKLINIIVEDTGIGIATHEIDNIFNQYYRVKNHHTQNVFGAGIGLSLVKKLVNLHHGNLEVESKEGKGTRFSISIPMSKESYKPGEIRDNFIENPDAVLNLASIENLPPTDLPKLPSSTVKRRVLLVEDNEELLKFLSQSLSDAYEVIEARDGREALEVAEFEKPDIIVSDVMMPYVNGFELCREIKTNKELSHIPVILLTAKSSDKDQYRGLELGADEYLTKPANIQILKLRIRNLLDTYESVKSKYENKLIGDIDKLEISDNHKDFVRKVVKILEDNITSQDLSIDFFASRLGVSRTLLYEKIKKATGESLGIFIKTNRLNYSAKLLLENHYNTSELAYAVGFSDPKYFSKCFRKQFGQTPKEFLKSKMDAIQ